jgi:hypothetical protein
MDILVEKLPALLIKEHFKTLQRRNPEWKLAFWTDQKIVENVLLEDDSSAIVTPSPQICHCAL